MTNIYQFRSSFALLFPSQGYSRKGAALSFLNKKKEAEEAYKAGLKVDPNNQQLKDALNELEAAADGSHSHFATYQVFPFYKMNESYKPPEQGHRQLFALQKMVIDF